MKNKFFGKNVILSVIFLIVIVGIFVLFKGTYTLDNASTTYTRKDLQDMVVSTALSYLHNNRYTDYDQKSVDINVPFYKTDSGGEVIISTFNWRNPNVSPEEVSRTNIFSIDCSSFVAIVYKYSLGYDSLGYEEFWKVYNNLPYYGFDTESMGFERSRVTKYDELPMLFEKYGMGTKVKYYVGMSAISFGIKNGVHYDIIFNVDKNNIDTYDENGATFEEQFKPYIDASNTKIGTFLYETSEPMKGNFDKVEGEEEEPNEVVIAYEKMIDLLEPGDIISYNSSEGGHSMLYLGNSLGEDAGFIHSGGSLVIGASDSGDYVIRKDGTWNIGDDLYSVRFDTMDTLKGYLKEHSVTFLAVTRPINKYLSLELKDREKAPDNAGNDRMILKNENIATNGNERTAFKWIRTEQYVTKTTAAINSKNLNEIEENVQVNISKYNSINEGERITYNLELENKSGFGYCTGFKGGRFSLEKSCIDDDEEVREWKIFGTKQVFDEITVSAIIPDNTEFEECNLDCTRKGNTLSWTIDSLGINALKKISYTVTVTGGDKIINEGMEIEYQGNTLEMGKLVTNVNPTTNELTVKKLMESINDFSEAVSVGTITHGDNSEHTVKIDSLKSEGKFATFNSYGFVKNIYYDAFDIDLGIITSGNVKNAIFNKSSQYDAYAKKTEEEITNLTVNAIKINKMLVKGFYGGRYLRGNDNGDRPGRLRITDLEVGDIIVYYTTSSKGTPAADTAMYMYLGNGGMSDCEIFAENDEQSDCKTPAENDKKGAFIAFNKVNNDSKLKIVNSTTDVTAHQFFNELWSKDLFVVLRPSQLYGTTVKYSGSTISGVTASFEYGTYKNLRNPTTRDGTVMLDYNNDEYNCTDCKTKYLRKEVFGWYESKNATEPLYYDNENFYKDLVSDKTHIIYGKWEFALPQVVVNGKVISGWYKDEALSNKVGDAYGTRYTIVRDVNETLYAKWEDEITYSHNDKCEKVGNKLYCKINENTNVYDFKNSIGVKPGYDSSVNYKNVNGNKVVNTGGITRILRSWDSSNDEIIRYTNVVRGDTDGDGAVSASDVSMMFQYYRGTNEEPIKDISIMAGDVVKNDGEIKLTDVAKLFQYANGTIDSLG